MRHGLTAQVMVRNEPFIYYAVKSVYDYVDMILISDTGSIDHTIDDIRQLQREDYQDKIRFKEVVMEVDETQYSQTNIRQYQELSKGKRNKVDIRNEQISDTETDFFLLLDGDEIHYRDGIKGIKKYIDTFPEDKVCGLIPEIWFSDLQHTFKCYSPVGRIFRTNAVYVGGISPDERHINIKTGKVVTRRSSEAININVKPYAHFMKYLKPWRHEVTITTDFTGTLPEVMIENDFYIRRFEQHES